MSNIYHWRSLLIKAYQTRWLAVGVQTILTMAAQHMAQENRRGRCHLNAWRGAAAAYSQSICHRIYRILDRAYLLISSLAEQTLRAAPPGGTYSGNSGA